MSVGEEVPLADIAGAKVEFTIAGKTYRGRKITCRMIGELQEVMRRQFTKAAMDACGERQFDPAAQRDVIRRVAATPLGITELLRELSSPFLMSHLIHLSIRDAKNEGPVPTVDDILDMDMGEFTAISKQIEAMFPTPEEGAETDPLAQQQIASLMAST